jgi:hypothetical protein
MQSVLDFMAFSDELDSALADTPRTVNSGTLPTVAIPV